MHESESATNAIDEIAAAINADAARLAGLVTHRIHAAQRSRVSSSRPSYMGDPTEEQRERKREKQQEDARDEERATAMAEHVEAIRWAAAELQRLEAEVRAKPSIWSLALQDVTAL